MMQHAMKHTINWNRLFSNSLNESINGHILTEISADDAYSIYYNNVPQDYYNMVRDLFSNNGKMNPMVRFWLEIYDFGIANTILSQINNYAELFNSITDSDLRQNIMSQVKHIKTVGGLYKYTNNIKAIQKSRIKGDTLESMLYRVKSNYNIIAPLTYGASERLFGDRTDWCTAKDEEDFYKYCNQDEWLVTIDDAYQICINRSGKIEEFRDDADEDMIDSPDYFICGRINGKPMNHDQIMDHYNKWLNSEDGTDDFYCDFLIGELDYEKFHGDEWQVDFTREFKDLYGEDTYNKIMQALPTIIERGLAFKNKQ